MLKRDLIEVVVILAIFIFAREHVDTVTKMIDRAPYPLSWSVFNIFYFEPNV